MVLVREFMLARAAARDVRYDGVFLTCVRTTGIYCLPSCKARSPRPENVEHCATPDEARARGFRACRRCRPDDHYAGRDPAHERLLQVLHELHAAPGGFADAGAVARRLGVGATKAAALFRHHLHGTPADTLLACRIAFACDRLATTRSRVLDVALDAGFASSSAFHDNFRRRTGTTPEGYRRLLRSPRFALQLPRQFPVGEFLRLWGRDAASACERVDGDTLHKAIVLAGQPAVLTVRLAAGQAHCQVHGARVDAAVARAAHAVIARMLDLAGDAAPGVRVLLREPALRPLLALRPGLRILPAATPWESLLWAIAGQQVAVAFASLLRAAVIRRAGVRVGDLVAHPGAHAVAALSAAELRGMKLSAAKSGHLLSAAAAVASGALPLDDPEPSTATRVGALLDRCPGVGPWTRAYVQLRGYGFVDALPVGDAALALALQQRLGLAARPDAGAMAALCARFAPFRGQLATQLWNGLADPVAEAGG